VLTELKNRGAGDVCMVVCDGLKGLPDGRQVHLLSAYDTGDAAQRKCPGLLIESAHLACRTLRR